MRHIAAAAIMDHDGEVYSLPPPARHGDVMDFMIDEHGIETPITGEQGFVCEDGLFVGRKVAYSIAKKAGQLLPNANSKPKISTLLSEDVW